MSGGEPGRVRAWAHMRGSRGDALSTAREGGPGRARACAPGARQRPGVSSAGVGDGASWAGHCGHFGPVALGLFFLFLSFFFCFLSSFSFLFCF
jgi:hypothetical protein